MDYKKFILVFILNLAIALGYYFENLNADVTDISSDLCNIIPICKKLDKPELYKDDLYLNDINDVKYYTPFYVQSLRAMAVLSGGDYIQALNLLSFIIHLLYGVLWFYFFYNLRKDFWLALLFSVFFRGILWPPGGELLGISDLWTAMPRTLFIALAPLPFLVYVTLKKYRTVAAAFILGLILNFHPISGVGMTMCYFSAYILYCYYNGGFSKKWVLDLIIAGIACFLGILPYLLTYLFNAKYEVSVDPQLFVSAFKQRLGDTFSDPIFFITLWNRPILYLLLISYTIYYFIDSSVGKRNFKILLFTMIIIFFSANASVYIEHALNNIFDSNVLMSFQLIRFQKFILVLLQIGLFLLLADISERIALTDNIKKVFMLVFLITLSISTMPVFSGVPFIGDDLITSILPEPFKVQERNKVKNMKDLGLMISYIKDNTSKDAVFYGSFMIRAGAARSVKLDAKGAGMLIEGNRKKFVEWYLQNQKLDAMVTTEKIIYLRSLKVSYIMSDKSWTSLIPVKKIGKFHLYKI